jgi:hypothetical protein
MSETTLTVQQVIPAGKIVTLAAANADGSQFLNDGRTWLVFTNTGVQSTVTIHAQGLCEYGFEHDLAVVIPATTTVCLHIGPLDTTEFNLNGYAHFTITSVAGVTVAAVKV